MSGEVLINLTPMETRVAVVENGVLQEALIERTRRRGIVGNIYKGRVVRVLPGMQAAFVDIGLDRAAFIHAHEIMPPGTPPDEQVSIGHLLHEGQALVVQVTKDPIGSKGARLTTHLSVPSRYLVYMPDSPITASPSGSRTSASASGCARCWKRARRSRSSRSPADSSCAPRPRTWARKSSMPTCIFCCGCGERSASAR